jgi:3-phosphoshikimate 1-carboxyvinyltransferase
VISVLAAFSQGTSRIAGLGRLANKESDRAAAILNMLKQMGVEVRRDGDELIIKGYTLVQRLLGQGLLRGGNYTSHHDHRMVMALKVASLGAASPIIIDDEACVEKSFPSFVRQFERIK